MIFTSPDSADRPLTCHLLIIPSQGPDTSTIQSTDCDGEYDITSQTKLSKNFTRVSQKFWFGLLGFMAYQPL